jgi:hypothetical protein
VAAPRAGACHDLAGADARPTFTGRLSESSFTREGFAGPPENVLLLELPRQICITDGGQFADPAQHFSSVQIGAADERLFPRLRALLGRQVTVSGEAFAAHTAHHYRPLVLMADRVSLNETPGAAGSAEFNTVATVQAFYNALGSGRYEFAGNLVIPAKRSSGPLSAPAMARYYSTFERPLQLTGTRRVGATSVIANYNYVLPGGRRCSGEAVVDLVPGEDGAALIERIRTVNPC